MTAFWALIAFLLSYGAYLNAVNETGTDSGSGPFIMRVIIVATGALTVASLVIIAVDSRRLRRLPAEVRTAAAGAAKHHPVRAHAHRYPPRHYVSWIVGWVGMVLIVFVAVVCFPGTVDGIGYLAGAGKSATFTGQSYDQSCGSLRGGCQTVTDGTAHQERCQRQLDLARPGAARAAVRRPRAGVELGGRRLADQRRRGRGGRDPREPAARRGRRGGCGAVRPDDPQLAAAPPAAGPSGPAIG